LQKSVLITPKGNQLITDILKQCELPFDAFKVLKDYTEKYGKDFFSTPFDEDSVAYLESIGCNLYKVASFDVVNHRLLSKIAGLGRPILMSAGMADLEEIESAYRILKQGTDRICLLHCVSAYPTREQDANLAAIYELRNRFDCVIGQSDHTNDIRVPLFAVAAGAQVIEKHFKIDETMDCVDAPVSITENQMKKLVEEIRRIEQIFGSGEFGLSEAETATAGFRRHTGL